MIEIFCRSTEETQQLAQALGRVLRGNEAIELVSDVGGGKTTFVKGLAKGLDINEVVQSPTFTISRLYNARDGLELHHFDFYRLNEAGVVAAELAESLAQTNAIVAVEWGDIVHDVLPKDHITLQIKNIGEHERRLVFTIPASFEYIAEALSYYKEQRAMA